jgi:hypothetical protein
MSGVNDHTKVAAAVTKAETIWTLRTVTKHLSANSNSDISEILKMMFPNSEVAQSFTCGADKTAYIAKFGLLLISRSS